MYMQQTRYVGVKLLMIQWQIQGEENEGGGGTSPIDWMDLKIK